MSARQLLFLTLFLFTSGYAYGQEEENIRSLFVQAEYQALHYNFLSVGLGYQPEKGLLNFPRKNLKFSFIGYTANFTKTLNNSDWGASVQAIGYSGATSGPLGGGLEVNYKSVKNTNHYGIKPLLGLSFPIVSIMFGYNFDFYKVPSERINQFEIIFGLRYALLRTKPKGISMR
jgi:hypothetical protein